MGRESKGRGKGNREREGREKSEGGDMMTVTAAAYICSQFGVGESVLSGLT